MTTIHLRSPRYSTGYENSATCRWPPTTVKPRFRLRSGDRPHLILLDLCLPDMEGGDVCAQLADAPETCGTPVIIISGLDRPDIIRHSRSVGGDFFLRKPYDPNVLLTLIERTLAGDEWL